jgi:hypothetical protein
MRTHSYFLNCSLLLLRRLGITAWIACCFCSYCLVLLPGLLAVTVWIACSNCLVVCNYCLHFLRLRFGLLDVTDCMECLLLLFWITCYSCLNCLLLLFELFTVTLWIAGCYSLDSLPGRWDKLMAEDGSVGFFSPAWILRCHDSSGSCPVTSL